MDILRLLIPSLFVLWTLTGPGEFAAEALDRTATQIAVFRADITPPIGEGMGIGFMRKVTSIEHPLFARGIVLRDDGGTYILCALDLGGLCNDSCDLFRETIARAANILPAHVAVQSLHQHTAPVYDADARRILHRDDPETLNRGLDFANQSADNIADSVSNAMKSFQTVTHLGTSLAVVERVASNRRVPRPDGTLVTRSSASTDPFLQAAPEGIIDPWLRTVTFFDNDIPLVRLHYYATHPQSYYGDSRISYDVPGIAIQRLQDRTGVPQIYFTGCGGNIGMGKYNDGTPEARGTLVDRLYDAMERSIAALERSNENSTKQPVTPIRWSTKAIYFPLRDDAAFTADAQRAILTSDDAPFSQRLKASELLAWINRVEAKRPVELSCLAMSNVRLVHLPGEPFVQFQLAAQRLAPNEFVAVAGYGECAMWYIGEDRIYTDRGGYEQSWAFAGPCENLLQKTIAELLTGNGE